MNKIRPIETIYDGQRFRSRIAVRWAIFMDTLAVPYEYRPESFDLGGTIYTPDFWLPEQQCWMDAGRDFPSPDTAKAARSLAALSLKPVHLFCQPTRLLQSEWVVANGTPHTPAAYAIRYYPDGSYSAPFMWCRCSRCEKLTLEHSGYTDGACCLREKREGAHGKGLAEAYRRATLARFAYDETSAAYRRIGDE